MSQMLGKLRDKYKIGAGWSYAVGELILSLVSKHPFNVDTMRTLNKTSVEVEDDFGKSDMVNPSLKNHRSSRGLTHLQERDGWMNETVVSLSIPEGYQKEYLKAIQSLLPQFTVTQLKEWRDPEVQKPKGKKVRADAVLPDESEAHHNEKRISATQAIDSFMFWLLKPNGHVLVDHAMAEYLGKYDLKPQDYLTFARRLQLLANKLLKAKTPDGIVNKEGNK